MLTSMVVVSPPGAFWADLVIPLYPSPTDPLIIRDVKGLEPVSATVNSRGYANEVDGEFYTGSHVGKRNIVILLGLNNKDAQSVAEARKKIYFYFMPKNFKTKLRFLFDDRANAEIEGYIESTTGDRFTKDPEIQISVICPKPNFFSTARQINGQSNAADSEAPYAGSAGGALILELFAGATNYVGDIFIESKESISSPTYRTMSFYGITIPAGSKLFVSTHQGNKRAEIQGSGNPINQFGQMGSLIYWMGIHAGTNLFRVRTPGSTTPLNWVLNYADQETGV